MVSFKGKSEPTTSRIFLNEKKDLDLMVILNTSFHTSTQETCPSAFNQTWGPWFHPWTVHWKGGNYSSILLNVHVHCCNHMLEFQIQRMLKENETEMFLVAYPRVDVHKPSLSLCVLVESVWLGPVPGVKWCPHLYEMERGSLWGTLWALVWGL